MLALAEPWTAMERDPERSWRDVIGQTNTGTGVRGSAGPFHVAVVAQNAFGLALNVIGRARFTTAGSGTIQARADSVAVSNSAVQANRNVVVTLTSDPGDAQIAWVERIQAPGSCSI